MRANDNRSPSRDVGSVKLDSAPTVQGQPLQIQVQNGKVRVNGAQVIKADIECTNGVIHVIDAVLLPPEAASAASKGSR